MAVLVNKPWIAPTWRLADSTVITIRGALVAVRIDPAGMLLALGCRPPVGCGVRGLFTGTGLLTLCMSPLLGGLCFSALRPGGVDLGLVSVLAGFLTPPIQIRSAGAQGKQCQ